MIQPLQGWDLATWRVTQSQNGMAANVVAIVEINGVIDVESLVHRVEKLLEIYPPLSMAVSKSEPFNLYAIQDLKPADFVSNTNNSVIESATRLANFRIGPDDCLWRIEIANQQGRSYLICSINHAIADGNTALLLMQSLLDNPREINFKTNSETNSRDAFEELKGVAGNLISRVTKDPAGLARDLGEMLQSISRLLAINSNVESNKSEHNLKAYFYKIDKRQIQNFVQGKQISTHDVLVGLVVRSLQRYFELDQDSKESFLINVPVAMNIDELSANKILVARINFPRESQPALEMMKLSRENLRKWRNEPSLKLARSLVSASQFLPIDLIINNLKSSDATISTLISDSEPKRIFGLEVRGIWPLLAPIGAGLNFTSVTFQGYVHIGVCIDQAVISDERLWFESLHESAREIFGQKLFEQIFE